MAYIELPRKRHFCDWWPPRRHTHRVTGTVPVASLFTAKEIEDLRAVAQRDGEAAQV